MGVCLKYDRKKKSVREFFILFFYLDFFVYFEAIKKCLEMLFLEVME